ncbi:MAG: TetR/AcrR family transcriptional regulator [Lysinibacillus sp.]
MKEQDLRVIKTKKALFQALVELLKSEHFHEITVTKICNSAQVNRSTFYAHYANIDELFEQYFNDIMEDLEEDYEGIVEQLNKLKKESMVPLYEHILANRSFYDMLLSENAPLKYVSVFNQLLIRFPKEVIDQNVSEETDLELYYAFCASATMGIIYHWKNSGYAKTPREVGIQTMNFFTRDL